MVRSPIGLIPERKKYVVSCILFISLFCLFNYFLILKTKVVRVDFDLEVPQSGTLRIFSPKDETYTDTFKASKSITPDQRNYSLRIPCRAGDDGEVLLTIAPFDASHPIKLNEISIHHPFFKKLSLDIPAQFNSPENYSNIDKIQYLHGGGVEITGSNENPYFHVKNKLKLSTGLVSLLVFLLCFCLWILFHPAILKGNRKGGYLMFVTMQCEWSLVEPAIHELEECCRGLVLMKSLATPDRQTFVFTFKEINEFKVTAVCSSLQEKGVRCSLRIQMNRSGEQ